MVVSILVDDDEADVAELFRQRFRREARQGIYVLHFAQSVIRPFNFSTMKSSRSCSRSCPTSTCRGWMDCSCSAKSSSGSPTPRS
jgi:hypothetical protein